MRRQAQSGKPLRGRKQVEGEAGKGQSKEGWPLMSLEQAWGILHSPLIYSYETFIAAVKLVYLEGGTDGRK